MLIFYLTVCCVHLLGASSVRSVSECYGSSLTLPFSYSPPIFDGPLYFISKSGSRKLLMDEGKSKDRRLKVSLGRVRFTDLTERHDGGSFSVSTNGNRTHVILSLTIKECSETITQYYGDIYSINIPREAEFLEFTPLGKVKTQTVLWNRTAPTSQRSRGSIKHNGWVMKDLTQDDMGHYNVRAKDNTLLSRKGLAIEANKRTIPAKVNEMLAIKYPRVPTDTLWTVTFTPEGKPPFTLIERGHSTQHEIGNNFFPIEVKQDRFVIDPVKSTDSGTFEFIDPQGNLALTTEVVVQNNPKPFNMFVYIGIGVAVAHALILCCCCVTKCCCKKSSSKRDESAPQTASAPAVYYHDLNQPAGPSSSAAPAPDNSYQPMNSLFSREPTNISLEPPAYSSMNIHVNPPQPEFAPLGRQGLDPAPLLGSDCLSSDPEQRFELKGLTFPSAPPLGSDSTVCDVYTSDKLSHGYSYHS
ncbi:uncharacterized protein LOC119494011 isoform X1 [Sebastes umbrosus]|uniref:uncharacterized protein LOC119494011 isoform X1 n=1 Tax=Sebastes umbrosus TaxID=72105 RepID=UPI0018A08CA2|nr:uncharacterized protein LOC119494011 isoform X1 [Sebastes umbrosus]